MNKKAMQRHVNRTVRTLNLNIANDTLWRGRFVVRQLQAFYGTYSDGSGLYATYCLLFTDLKTGRSKKYYFDNLDFLPPFVGRVWWAMNEFIVEYCRVWDESDLKTDTTVYRK